MIRLNAKTQAWMLLLIAGCRNESIELAREAADRQAAQNALMGRLQRDVTRGTERLVAADAAFRSEAAATYRQMQDERHRLASQLESLESQRRQLDERRQAAATLGSTLRGCGVLLISALTLLVVYSQLASARADPVTSELAVDLLADAYNQHWVRAPFEAEEDVPQLTE